VQEDRVLCGRCGQVKPRSAFYDLRHTTRPRRPCKDCILADKRARYASGDGDRVSHAQVLREKYRITLADYDAMLAGQHGVCAICREPETARGRGGAPRRLTVDQDRRTGAVRQLLCHRCNLLVRAVEEDPARLDEARAYLARHSPGRESAEWPRPSR
jgi:hypothetical protein